MRHPLTSYRLKVDEEWGRETGCMPTAGFCLSGVTMFDDGCIQPCRSHLGWRGSQLNMRMDAGRLFACAALVLEVKTSSPASF